jgi:hypothetical protein
MKKILLSLVILLSGLVSSLYGQGSWRPGEMEIRVALNYPQQADQLRRLGLKGDLFIRSGYALLYVIPEELELLKSGLFPYEILKEDLNEFSKDFWLTRDQYHTYDEIIQSMDTLCILHPDICKKFDYGLSVEGRQLCALKISDNVNDDESEAEIMFDGGIHGDEIGGPENLVRFAEMLCGSYGVDPEITSLVNEREIWLYMMVNPDGRVNMVRYNSNGVDLNRDWGYMWDGDGSSPDYYSQVETRALRTCMLENQFVVHTSYHSGTEFLAYPWSYRPDPSPDQAHIHQLAGIYSSTSGYPALPYEQGYTGMYAINGSSKDAAYGVMGSIGWTMEISYDKQPPVSQIQYYYDINEPAMLAVIEYAGYGINGTVTDAGTGEPVAAAVFINDYYTCYNDPVVGDYHKYLLAGSYSVTAVANGYQPLTQTALIINNTSTTLDFALQAEYNHYAYRVMACEIPGTNFADEGRTSAALRGPDDIHYSLGKSGRIILDMQENIIDGPGNEIIVHEGDIDPEGFACYAASGPDGPWALVGNGTGTTTFDFASGGIAQARYIRINDDGDGPVYIDNAGFDLDAVEVPEQPQMIYLVMDCLVDDPAGNENGRIDPGENFDLIITLHNLGGMMMENGQAFLNIDPEFISVVNPDLNIGNLDFGESAQLVFTMNCSSFCPAKELLMTVLNINSNDGSYLQSFPVNFTAGAIVEDWESAGLTNFDWVVSGNKPWAINFLNPYEGTYTAKSGNIDDNEISALEVTLDVIGYDDISFYRRVSSEEGSDYLKFYIDNNLADHWSGEQSWALNTYQVSPGYHTFKWTFEKDGFNSQGSDGSWIDYILFPSCNLDGTLKALANAIPHEFCGGGQSQLGAYVIGGTGNYNFAWTPSSTLNDSTIQFPIADIEATTWYSVNINDDEYSVSSDIEVNVYPVPQTPVIHQDGDSLISSASEGNQWYDNTGPIPGATGQVFYPPVEGDYFVAVMSEYGCMSDSSNIIHFLFTGYSEEEVEPAIMVYPNPFQEEINIHFIHTPLSNITLKIIDIMGKEIVYNKVVNTDLQELIIYPSRESKKGLYLISILDQNGDLLISRKLIKY